MPIKTVHCADLHIGAAHSLLGRNAARRSAEVLNSLYSVAVCCKEQNADVLLIAGDLFDSPCPSESDIKCVKEYLAGIPDTRVFITPGNHDYLTPSSPYMTEWSENVHIFRTPECVELENARVYGIPFTQPYCDGFALPCAENDDKINILLMHGDIFGGPYNPLTEQKIAATGMDYVALGHVHAPSGVKYAERVPYAYPGSVEPLGFDEIGERGVLAGTLLKTEARLNPVRLCKRVFCETQLDLSQISDNSELIRRAGELIADFRDDMVKLILTGESDFSPDCELVKTSLEDAVFHLRVKDLTYPKENLALLRKEQTLKGIFTDRCLKFIESLRDEEKDAAEKALCLGLAAFAGREVGFRED